MSVAQQHVDPCVRCHVGHHGRLACSDTDLARCRLEAAGSPVLPAPGRVDEGAIKRALILRLRPTPTSFGWKGRIALTVPPIALLLALARIMGLGLEVYVLTVGGPTLFFTLWWTKRVWESPRRR